MRLTQPPVQDCRRQRLPRTEETFSCQPVLPDQIAGDTAAATELNSRCEWIPVGELTLPEDSSVWHRRRSAFCNRRWAKADRAAGSQIECDEKRPFRVAVRPHVLIFASVLVLAARFSGPIAFSFVEVFQFAVGGVHKPRPKHRSLDPARHPRRHNRRLADLSVNASRWAGSFARQTNFANGHRCFICAQSRFEPYAKYNSMFWLRAEGGLLREESHGHFKK